MTIFWGRHKSAKRTTKRDGEQRERERAYQRRETKKSLQHPDSISTALTLTLTLTLSLFRGVAWLFRKFPGKRLRCKLSMFFLLLLALPLPAQTLISVAISVLLGSWIFTLLCFFFSLFFIFGCATCPFGRFATCWFKNSCSTGEIMYTTPCPVRPTSNVRPARPPARHCCFCFSFSFSCCTV